jgi:hypothetical protein
MTFQKSRLTTLLALDKGHSYIETCLLSVGCLGDSVTTNVPTAGPTQEATGKIIDLQNYVSKQSTK